MALVVGNVSADILIDNFTDATNDRFTNSASFIGLGQDFSGVARSAGNRWGTLISNNVIISADHAQPVGTFEFYPGNDPTQAPVVRTLMPGVKQQIGSSDLFLHVLASPVPSSINVYDFATEAISAPPYNMSTNGGLHTAGSFQNEMAYLFGISETVRGNTVVDQAVGRNRISGYIENLPFGTNTDNDSLVLIYDESSDSDYLQYEARLQAFDSGAPLFIERNGDLLLLGINSFSDGAGGAFTGVPRPSSGITYTGNLTDEINTFIATHAVPEPGSLGVILFAIAGLVTGRRRRQG